MRVEASGLCHTNIHAAHGDWPVKPSPPFIPGHEESASSTRSGPGVSEVTVGARVAMPWLGYACGTCDTSVRGRRAQRAAASPVGDGGLIFGESRKT